MKTLKMIVTAILFLLTLGFGLLNHEGVTIHYYLGSLPTTSGFAMILFFVLGSLMGLIFGVSRKKK